MAQKIAPHDPDLDYGDIEAIQDDDEPEGATTLLTPSEIAAFEAVIAEGLADSAERKELPSAARQAREKLVALAADAIYRDCLAKATPRRMAAAQRHVVLSERQLESQRAQEVSAFGVRDEAGAKDDLGDGGDESRLAGFSRRRTAEAAARPAPTRPSCLPLDEDDEARYQRALLTPAEIEVVNAQALGRSARQIAKSLEVTVGTVKKLGSRGRGKLLSTPAARDQIEDSQGGCR